MSASPNPTPVTPLGMTSNAPVFTVLDLRQILAQAPYSTGTDEDGQPAFSFLVDGVILRRCIKALAKRLIAEPTLKPLWQALMDVHVDPPEQETYCNGLIVGEAYQIEGQQLQWVLFELENTP